MKFQRAAPTLELRRRAERLPARDATAAHGVRAVAAAQPSRGLLVDLRGHRRGRFSAGYRKGMGLGERMRVGAEKRERCCGEGQQGAYEPTLPRRASAFFLFAFPFGCLFLFAFEFGVLLFARRLFLRLFRLFLSLFRLFLSLA